MAGCSRAILYRRAEECPDVAAALEALKGRMSSAPRAKRTQRQDRARARTAKAAELATDGDVQLALETLRAVARGGGKDDSPRVSAAKALLAYAEARVAAKRKPSPAEPETASPAPAGEVPDDEVAGKAWLEQMRKAARG